MSIARNFGRQLEARLRRLGLSDRDLAREVKVSSAIASAWARGEVLPRQKYWDDICRVVDCSYAELVANPDGKVPDPIIQWCKNQLESAGYTVTKPGAGDGDA